VAWPPTMALTLRVARAAPAGTTGMRVTREASAGSSSVRTASSNAPMCSNAPTPRKGMLPWAMRPRSSTSNQYTPRCPMQTRSTLSGSGMIT
jgi:hypothetical protein